jgi:hypothetical protein
MRIPKPFLIFLILAACQTDPQQKNALELSPRFGSVTGLHPKKVAYYKQLHASTWSGVAMKVGMPVNSLALIILTVSNSTIKSIKWH